MKCFSRFVVLALTSLVLIGLSTSEMAEAATYGSGRKSFSSSSSRRSSFSSSNRSSSSSSSLFNSNRNSSSKPSGYQSGSSYSSKSSVNFDRDAAAAKKAASSSSTNRTTATSTNTGSRPMAPWPANSRSGVRSSFAPGLGATPTPPPQTEIDKRKRAFGDYAYYPQTNYRDRFDSAFWWWLLSRPREERARWAYHHTNDMDPARYQAMTQADAGLQEQVTALELAKTPTDTAYAPAGVEKELMYALELERPEDYVAPAAPSQSGQVWAWFWALAGGGFLIWLVFVKRWQVAPALR